MDKRSQVRKRTVYSLRLILSVSRGEPFPIAMCSGRGVGRSRVVEPWVGAPDLADTFGLVRLLADLGDHPMPVDRRDETADLRCLECLDRSAWRVHRRRIVR